MKLKFYGAAQEVTGSNHILEGDGVTIMVDCGFFQGVKVCDDKNNDPFPYDVSKVDALFVTHAHLDHVGRIPKLMNEGFKGRIYSTPPTREIAKLMLEDTLNVIAREAKADEHEPLYGEDAVKKAFEHWEAVPYDQDVTFKDDLRVRFRDAGHILGSAMIEMVHNGKKLIFSGDLGSSSVLMPESALLSGVDYMVMEAVYGDRVHTDLAERANRLRDIVLDTIKHDGVLVIPAFSIERTQDILFDLNKMVEANEIPEIPVFVDSPLAIKVTKVFSENPSYFNANIQNAIKGGDDIFKFPKLRFTERSQESIAIKDVPSPKIIIAGSGMSNGGRVMHHERNYLPDPNSTLLLVGYQAVGTMGRALQEGAKSVRIFDEDIPVNAKVVTLQGYSAHKDMNALVEFVSEMQDSIKKLFVVHAELGAGLFFAQRVRDYLGVDARLPKPGEEVEIDF
ncbi:MAG: MBL fold metallo-hydrolase [Candidatus Pacebacteria bacterium]|jgi:metallo-beta-lactamase family protein|nr:MBL fold metallo-hydrolase [Candidatus Paceibacterota bacterium]